MKTLSNQKELNRIQKEIEKWQAKQHKARQQNDLTAVYQIGVKMQQLETEKNRYFW